MGNDLASSDLRSDQPGEAVYISVVVPCQNEEACVKEFHRRLRRVLLEIGKPYEIIFANDDSSDRTAERFFEIQQLDENVVVIELSTIHGHQLALSA